MAWICTCGHNRSYHPRTWLTYGGWDTRCTHTEYGRDGRDRCPCGAFEDGEKPVTETQDPTATLALCKWLKDRLRVWEIDAKAALGLLPGERKAAVADRFVLGHVSMAKGRKSAKVVNEAAVLAYVKAHYPTEIEVEERVRPAFLKSLLDDVAKKGAFVDSDGVVIDGLIDVVAGDPYPIVKLADDADLTIAGLLARGTLGVNGLRQLEAGQ